MVNAVNTWGASEGVCNICGRYGPLTEDHIPPKGCIKIGQIQIHHIANHLSIEPPKGTVRKFQNGLKYKTLCGSCNNSLLGSQYDPEFIKFTNTISKILSSYRALPAQTSIRIKPQRVIRSLLGHIAAQGVGRFDKGRQTDIITSYLLNKNEPLPDFLNIYYWIYPYQNQVLTRDSVLTNLRVGEPVYIWLIKFFPIAFFVTWDEPKGYNFNLFLDSLSSYRNLAIDDEADVNVGFNNLPNQFWPEAPTDDTILAYGEEAIATIRK